MPEAPSWAELVPWEEEWNPDGFCRVPPRQAGAAHAMHLELCAKCFNKWTALNATRPGQSPPPLPDRKAYFNRHRHLWSSRDWKENEYWVLEEFTFPIESRFWRALSHRRAADRLMGHAGPGFLSLGSRAPPRIPWKTVHYSCLYLKKKLELGGYLYITCHSLF